MFRTDLPQHVGALLARLQTNPYNAFVTVSRDLPEQSARIAECQQAHTAGTLAGITVAVKDNICLEGYPVTCASHSLETFVAPYDATVVTRLRQADALLIGKTNLDEFAMGSSTEYSAFGVVQNPWAADRVPGGSSGGSAAAVAGDLADVALGSDTGGSIRQPAAFCGLVGLKPTYGRVSRWGLVAFASSLDQIGLFARQTPLVARVLQVIAGHDPHDSTSVAQPVPDYFSALEQPVKNLRVGVPSEYFQEGLDAQIRARLQDCQRFLQAGGLTVVPVSLPHTQYAIAVYYIIATAEASSNLARYDGVRYGLSQPGTDLDDLYHHSRHNGFGAEVTRRIMLGTYVLSAGYYGAYYDKAQRVRRLIRDDFSQAFQQVDVLLTPTTPTPAFAIGGKTSDPLAMYLSDIYTVPASLAGVPAVNIPLGCDKQGLPIGGQLIGRYFEEETILRLGHYIERNFQEQ